MELKINAAGTTEWRQNWKVVLAAGLGLALMNLPVHSVGIFMNALEADLGWKRSIIASGMMFTSLSSILFAPLVGMVVDRFGPRRVALIGSSAVCVSFGMLGLTTANPLSWWLLWAFLSLWFVLVMPMVWTSAVSGLFNASRGLALAVTLSGTALTSSVLPVTATLLIGTIGWRSAYFSLAAIYALVVIPIVFLFFTSVADRNRQEGDRKSTKVPENLPGIPARDAAKSSRFIRLLIAASAMIFTPSITSSFIPIMVSFGHSRMSAAGVAGMIGIAGLAGRMAGGYLLDRINGNVVAAICTTFPILGILAILILPHSMAAFTVAAILMGLSVGAELDAVAYLVTRHFGLRSFGTLYAVISTFGVTVMAAGPVALNYIFDVSGSYQVGLIATIPVCALASILFFTLGEYRFGVSSHHAPQGVKARQP